MAYKYRLKLTKPQIMLFNNHFFTSNQAYNICLGLFKQESEDNKLRKKLNQEPVYLTSIEMDNRIKSILNERKLKFNTKVIQQARINFQNEKKQFFKALKKENKKDRKGELQFKSFFKSQHFETTKEQYSLLDYIDPKTQKISKKYKILRLFKENILIHWSRELPCEPKTIKVKKKNDIYTISFVFDQEIQAKKNKKSRLFHKNKGNIDKLSKRQLKSLKPLGMDINIDHIDIGNKDFHSVIKNVDKEENLIKKYKKKIKLLKRKNSRRIQLFKQNKSELKKYLKNIGLNKKEIYVELQEQKLPNNYYKTLKKINKLEQRNMDKKDYELHKLSNEIIKIVLDNGSNVLFVEDLKIKLMTSKKNINKKLGKEKSKSMKKNILYTSPGKLLNILEYKCTINEIYFKKVDPFNTTKKCSQCGNIQNMELKDREYNCCACGSKMDRDYNSVLNIIDVGVETTL